MSRIYSREIQLTISSSAATDSANRIKLTDVIIKDLRMRFDIEKKIGKEPNTCMVIVTNLSEASRGIFEKRPLSIRLDAGYDSDIERLFAGDLISAKSTLVGTDWETELQLADGARAFMTAHVKRSYRAGTTVRTCLRDVAKSFGLSLPKMTGPKFNPLDKQFATGVVLFGLAHRELTRLLKPGRFEWSIQDGKLQILPPFVAKTETKLIISQDSGLVGSPEFGTPEKEGKPPLLTIVSKLRPRASPGGLIEVKSQSINGNYRLSTVKHLGDNYSDPWDTTMEASQV